MCICMRLLLLRRLLFGTMYVHVAVSRLRVFMEEGVGRTYLGRGADNSILEYTYLVVIILQKSRATQSSCTCAAKS